MTISYIPILKAKRSELSALSQLSIEKKSKILPLLEIEPVPIDPDSGVALKSYNETLIDFGKKVSKSCSNMQGIYIDGLLIEEHFISSEDHYPIINAVNQVRDMGIRVIPVSSPTRQSSYKRAIDGLMQNEICLRLTTLDLVNPQLITHYINHLGIPLSNIDIIIDLRDELTEDKLNSGELYTLAIGLINNLAHFNEYRKVILSGGSFPTDLSDISVGLYSQPRIEWILWQSLMNGKELARNVIYSDYGVQHPDFNRLSTRFPSVSASVRYSGDNDFWVFRGRVANRFGYEQYGKHSEDILAHREYSGPTFCAGDKDIEYYANEYQAFKANPSGNYKFGSPEVWRRIGQNHHITKVVEQLATLYGL
ncbi:beta family protein [Escherichia coli]|nr:beta family protein [Escherichia coli]EFK5193599.1 beta family protein [Escherichia coli]EGJ2250561.1 beta family protein [Escherichia coli]